MSVSFYVKGYGVKTTYYLCHCAVGNCGGSDEVGKKMCNTHSHEFDCLNYWRGHMALKGSCIATGITFEEFKKENPTFRRGCPFCTVCGGKGYREHTHEEEFFNLSNVNFKILTNAVPIPGAEDWGGEIMGKDLDVLYHTLLRMRKKESIDSNIIDMNYSEDGYRFNNEAIALNHKGIQCEGVIDKSISKPMGIWMWQMDQLLKAIKCARELGTCVSYF